MMIFNKEQVLFLYKRLVEATGGAFGIREESLLDSAISAPYHSFGGVDLYPSLIEKAARLGYGLVANHPFIDGNKRIGLFVMLTFLEVNGIDLEFTDDEIVNLALKIADTSYKYEEVLAVLNAKL